MRGWEGLLVYRDGLQKTGFKTSFLQKTIIMITLETVSSNTRSGIEDTTTVAVETFAKFVKDRLDVDVENKSIVDHKKMVQSKLQ